jgi:hypothetical protein
MGKFFAQEYGYSAHHRKYPYPFLIMIIPIQDEFTAIAAKPTGVRVNHYRQYAVCLTFKSIVVPFIKVAGRIVGKMAFKGE